jgi:hypothetical protein
VVSAVTGRRYRKAMIRLTDLQQLLLHPFQLWFWSDTVRSSSGAAGADEPNSNVPNGPR